MIYRTNPPILECAEEKSHLVTVEKHFADISKRRIQKMMTDQIRENPKVKIGDYVYFWRDKSRWLGPAKSVQINDLSVKVIHDEKISSCFNRI